MLFSHQWYQMPYLNNWGLGGGTYAIVVYSGDQPIMEDYIANYDELYGINGENLLQVILTKGFPQDNGKDDHDESNHIHRLGKGTPWQNAPWNSYITGRPGNYYRAIISDPEREGYTQALYSVREGTGTWAAIRWASDPSQDNIDGYYQLTLEQVQSMKILSSGGNEGDGPQFNFLDIVTLVPISDLAGTGVIKFESTEFTHPDLDQEDRVLDALIQFSYKEPDNG